MPPFEFLEKLRSATSQHHQNLEKSIISTKLLSPDITVRDYINYLLASYRLHRSVEDEVFPILADTAGDIGNKQKAPAIQQDLLALGQTNLHDETKFLGDENVNVPFCLGVMYVIEGSTLGGLHIAKALTQTLERETPKAFLTIYGQATGQRWKQFLQLLDDFTKNNPVQSVHDDIIKGALFAFNKAACFFNDSYITYEL